MTIRQLTLSLTPGQIAKHWIQVIIKRKPEIVEKEQIQEKIEGILVQDDQKTCYV
jgi:hypothetical protein